MSSKLAPIILIALLVLSGVAVAQDSLQGFAQTDGGVGGAILRVTNLDASGPGSLRAVLEAKGPRVVVFEVGGVIDLEKQGLSIREPFLTIAGQTAPSPGITLIRGGMSISTHDVLVQHIRIRPGDAEAEKRSGWAPDGISTSGGNAYNIVIDHCSISWAVDENLSASGPRTEGPQATSHRITFSNCIIAEGLHDASHPKGPHSKGSLIHDFCQDIAIIGNLYAHNVRRNPYFKAHATGVIVNNLIYNASGSAIHLNYVNSEWDKTPKEPKNARVSIVGNVFVHGQDTVKNMPMISARGDAYMEDNAAFDQDGNPARIVAGKIVELTEKPVWPEGLEALLAVETAEYVLQHAGARPQDRDAVDERIVRDFRNRTGRVIDSQEDVGGYPKSTITTHELIVPDANIGAWLKERAAVVE